MLNPGMKAVTPSDPIVHSSYKHSRTAGTMQSQGSKATPAQLKPDAEPQLTTHLLSADHSPGFFHPVPLPGKQQLKNTEEIFSKLIPLLKMQKGTKTSLAARWRGVKG